MTKCERNCICAFARCCFCGAVAVPGNQPPSRDSGTKKAIVTSAWVRVAVPRGTAFLPCVGT